MPELFRSCPACRRRFVITLVSKKLLLEEKKQETFEKPIVPTSTTTGMASFGLAPPLVLEEDVPATVDIDDFQFTYRCKHCGHQWSEIRTEEHREHGEGSGEVNIDTLGHRKEPDTGEP
jgi:hypothetical protein